MQLDSVIISGLQSGQKDKFDQIYKLYWAELYAFARKRVNFDEDAQDILQDLFVNIWVNRTTLIINTSVRAYLFTALRHRIINYYSSNHTRTKYLEIIKQMEAVSEATDEQIAQNEINTIIDENLEKMPLKMREIFILSRFKGYSAKEIAAQLQLSEQTVRNQVSNALKYLKIGLVDFIPSLIFFIQSIL